MGFFSGLFGGSSGGSSSTATTKNEITVNPETNIDINFDLDALTNAINTSSKDNIDLELLKLKANIALEKQKALDAQETSGQFLEKLDKLDSYIPPIIALSALYFLLKGVKKNGKSIL